MKLISFFLNHFSRIALSAVNTLIAGSAGSFAALILGRTTPTGKFRWSYMTMLNGCIAGMVWLPLFLI